MNKFRCFIYLCLFGLGFALPSKLQAIENRFQHVTDSEGQEHLVDLLENYDDVIQAPRYDPVVSNVYHLFTRDNPSVSQPLLPNRPDLLQNSNFKRDKRTIVLIHGWMGSSISDINTVLTPAFLAAEDVNVIVVDWSAGASSIIYRLVVEYTIRSGKGVADFILWLNQETGLTLASYHIIGHSFGGHQAGIVGRNLQGRVAYITALDPGFVGWVSHPDRFHLNDGLYTEVIHTNYGVNGYLADLGHVDFYPNGGLSMPGCDSNACDHARSIFYFAESLTSGGFTGRRCLNYFAAILGACDMLPGTLQMGGLVPKTGNSGVYLLETNGSPPFSIY